MGAEIAQSVLGILGNIANCVFFLSSAPTVVRIVKQKSSGGLSGDLYVFKLFNCMLWTFYGLPIIHPNDFWVLLTNSFGCTFALLYIVPYFCYASRPERISVLWKLIVILGGFAVMVVLLLCLDHSQHNRIMVVGITCAVVSSGMHMTLLSQCHIAIQSRETRYLQPNSSIAAFVKGAMWTCYGIANLDIFIVIPNGVGMLIGVIQGMMVLVIKLGQGRAKGGEDPPTWEDPNKPQPRSSVQVIPEDTNPSTSSAISNLVVNPKVESEDSGGKSNTIEVETHQIPSRVSSWRGLSGQSSSSAIVFPINEDDFVSILISHQYSITQ